MRRRPDLRVDCPSRVTGFRGGGKEAVQVARFRERVARNWLVVVIAVIVSVKSVVRLRCTIVMY